MSSAKKKTRVNAFYAPAYICAAMPCLRPPEPMTVSQCAERYRVMPSKGTAMPGKWRNSVTPYLVGIMDEMNNPETEEVIFIKPTQVGGTECIFNSFFWIIKQDPSPTLVVYPSDDLGENISENRIQPSIKTSPEIAAKFNELESKKLELQFDGMYLRITGANSPSKLASMPIKYLFLDETDKYPSASRRESDPISLARERTKTFAASRKIYMCSTPTLSDGPIWKAKKAADIEKHYFMPCPHCGESIEFFWQQLKFPGKENEGCAERTNEERAAKANYFCQKCGAAISDADKSAMLKNGEWKAVRESGKKKVCYWLNTLYSPFVRFSDVALEFLKSRDDPDMLRNFINSWLAEPWENTQLKTSANLVLERQTEIPELIVPSWAKFITGGVDVQETCLYWTIRAFGEYITSQNITHGQALSFGEIANIMNTEYKNEKGEKFLVLLCLVDSGDQTDEVYNFCLENAEWALPVKGSSNSMGSMYKFSTINKNGSAASGMTLVLCDGGKYKDMIASRMRKPNGKGSWMVHKDCDYEYAAQVTAEHKISEKTPTGTRERWMQKESHGANHYLDTEVYAICAADIKNMRTLHLEEIQEENAQIIQKKTDSEDSWLGNTDEWI